MASKPEDKLVIRRLTSFENGGDSVRIRAELEDPIVLDNEGQELNVLSHRKSTAADKWYKRPLGMVCLGVAIALISASLLALGRRHLF
jgi:hypothetical protein